MTKRVQGARSGDAIHDDVFGAQARQITGGALKMSSTRSYFPMLPPGTDAAVFVGSPSGSAWLGTLPADGVSRVRVLSAAGASVSRSDPPCCCIGSSRRWRDGCR